LASHIGGNIHYFDGPPISKVNCDCLCFWVILVVAGVVYMGVIFYAKPRFTHASDNVLGFCLITLSLVELV